ncbi:hypothetical protein [Yoonia sp. SDW83-1]|uniref:hypothetical protein n=1 Tax=Yoonia sp. SDW83-1 TaxID=3366945 RepID=UPI00398C3F01
MLQGALFFALNRVTLGLTKHATTADFDGLVVIVLDLFGKLPNIRQGADLPSIK